MSSTSLDKSCKSFEESISKQLQDKSINITNIVNDLQREMSNAVQQLKLLQGFLILLYVLIKIFFLNIGIIFLYILNLVNKYITSKFYNIDLFFYYNIKQNITTKFYDLDLFFYLHIEQKYHLFF